MLRYVGVADCASELSKSCGDYLEAEELPRQIACGWYEWLTAGESFE